MRSIHSRTGADSSSLQIPGVPSPSRSPARHGPEVDVGRPARERLRYAVHQQQVRGAGEEEAPVAARAVLVHRALDGEEQLGLALHLVQSEPGRPPEEVPGGEPGVFPNLQVVERDVETIREKRLGPGQGALAGLAGAHQHDDRRRGKGALQQAGGDPGQIVQIDHDVGDYRSFYGR